MDSYVAPEISLTSFHCPLCGVFAVQEWFYNVKALRYSNKPELYMDLSSRFTVSKCSYCNEILLWKDEQIIDPLQSTAPQPVEDMPDDVKVIYQEARDVCSLSPSSAAALLRLALQRLCVHLGEPGKNINADIASLVKKGLPVKIQKALDVIRVIGNNAVHPGQIDLNENPDAALSLFKLLNFIVEQMITQPKQIDDLFDSLPENAKEAIEKRDMANI